MGSANNIPDHQLLHYRLGRELGWETARLGHGGSGYVQDGSGAGVVYSDTTRLAEIVTYAPDYVVVVGSLNDDAYPAADVGAGAAAVYSYLATNLPQTSVYVVGPQGTGSTVPAARLANRDAVKAAALAAPNVVGFIDPIAEQWITDANAATHVHTDATHLTAAGINHWANQLAKHILRPF